MIDYTKMDGPTMLHALGMDGYKWAEAFCQHNKGKGEPDESVMLVWFCNAIMHTLDTERGTVHNGDHAQWLIDNDETPYSEPAPTP